MIQKYLNDNFHFLLLTSIHFVLISYFLFPTFNLSFAQETYNLEIVFKKTHEPTTWYEGFGQALSSAGDVNLDGFDDILIGSPSGEVVGRCYLYFGGNPMDTLVDMTFYGDTAGDGFAVSVCSGDLNGDGVSDIIIGQPAGAEGYGVVQIYFGGFGMDSMPDLKIYGEVYAGEFGCAVASGDINGDAFDDLVVGAYAYNGFTLDGRVYVYYGGPLLDTIPDVVINGHNGESMGITVGSGGDVNSDGFEDIVIGAFNNDEAGTWAGKVYVFLGGNPMDTIPDCWLHGEGGSHYLGAWGVAMTEVLNNYDMVITGTRSYPEGFPGYRPGKIYVLYGGSPMDTIVDLWKVGETDSSWLGNWVAGAKIDVNTMFGDFLSGAPVEYQFDGRGYLWLGNNSIDSIYDAYLQGDIHYYGIGWKVASAGDVNGDGYDEVMFSNYASDSNQTVWVCRYTGEGIEETRGLGDWETRIIEVYPTICRDGFWILDAGYLTTDSKLQIKIYDVIGREVILRQGDGEMGGQGEVVIDMRSLPAGVYFVQVGLGTENVIKKVIKIK